MRENTHPFRHHEDRVEPDTELPDQAPRRAAAALLQRLQEGLGPGVRDRPEVLGEFLARQAVPVVRDRQRLGRVVRRDRNLQRQVRLVNLRAAGQLRVPQLLHGVRGIGHQLANEDLAVRVKRMNDDVQQLPDFRLKRLGVGCAHDRSMTSSNSGGKRHSRRRRTVKTSRNSHPDHSRAPGGRRTECWRLMGLWGLWGSCGQWAMRGSA